MNENYLTRSEVATKLKVTERTLKIWQANGKLLPYKLSGTIRYKESEVNEAFTKVAKKGGVPC